MSKKSQTIKEVIQVVVFLAVVGILAMVFLIYPLNRTKAFFARPDVDDYEEDSIPVNDITAFQDLPAAIDSFRVDADGLTTLACAYLHPAEISVDSMNSDTAAKIITPREPLGLVFLLHDEAEDRTAMIPLAQALLENGYAVCLYDQRASGYSTGTYHSDGEYEAADLIEVIGYLGIRDQLVHPVMVVGQAAGGDAGLLAAGQEERIDAVVALDPYLTSDRWLDLKMTDNDMYWIPFSHTLLEFWYELRSNYAPIYRDIETVEPPSCPALVFVPEAELDDETVTAYAALGDQIEIKAAPAEGEAFIEAVRQFVHNHTPTVDPTTEE